MGRIGGANYIEEVEEYFYGITTDERLMAIEDERVKLNIRRGITIFPWENCKDEIQQINSEVS